MLSRGMWIRANEMIREVDFKGAAYRNEWLYLVYERRTLLIGGLLVVRGNEECCEGLNAQIMKT